MKPDGPRLFFFNNCRRFIRTVPVSPRDEVDMDDVDCAAEDRLGEAGIRPRDERERQFRSRSVCRFPCGTKGFGIMTDYFKSGRGKQRRDRWAEAHGRY